jgi:hypothetical protein
LKAPAFELCFEPGIEFSHSTILILEIKMTDPLSSATYRDFISDRAGNRALWTTEGFLEVRSLRKFFHMVAGNPVIRQILIARDAKTETFNAALMGQAGRAAVNNPAVFPTEAQAVYVVTLFYKFPELASVYTGAAALAGMRINLATLLELR